MNHNNPNSTTNWEDLPKEILKIIGTHLKSRIDVFRFRAISTTCRSILSPSFLQSSSSPLFLPSPINGPTTLSPITICRLQNNSKTSSCLVKVIESNSGELQILSLTSVNSQIRRFFGTSSLKYLNMLDFRLIELSKSHVLTSNHINSPFKKVGLFGNEGILVLFNVSRKLGFWGFGDKEWTYLGQEGAHFDDFIILKNNQCYVIDNLGVISWIDSKLNIIQYSPPLFGCGQLKNLVESEGSFYVIDAYMEVDEAEQQPFMALHGAEDRRIRVDMKVYKLDEEWGTWVQVKSLGNKVFVLGKEVNLSVNIEEYPGCEGNCIYFIERNGGIRNLLVAKFFRLGDGSIRSVECFPTYRRLFSPSMMTR